VTLASCEPVTNGEEGDVTLLQVRTKLFRLDNEEKRWRECGVGPLRVNVFQHPQIVPDSAGKAKARIIMRHECHTGGSGTKLILNLPLIAATPVCRHAQLENAVQFCGVPADGLPLFTEKSQEHQFLAKVWPLMCIRRFD
jgi:hypothetical protein